MKACTAFLLICAVHHGYSRSYGVKRDNICDDVDPGTLVIKDDSDSCGTYIACIGQVAQYFKCFNDKVYSNGSSVCLSCNENNEEFYEDDSGGYGGRKSTKKKFTYKQTKKTKATSKKPYGPPTKPPKSYPSQTPSETETTVIYNFTVSVMSKY